MSRFHISFLAVCLLAVGLISAPAHADVTYTFTGTNNGAGGDGQTVSFQFTTSTFVSSLTSLASNQLTSCTHCQAGSGTILYLDPNLPSLGDGMQLNDSKNKAADFLFAAGDFGKAGTYNSLSIPGSVLGTGTLTVAAVAVPEPGSVALTFGGGIMLAMVCFFRRKPIMADNVA